MDEPELDLSELWADRVARQGAQRMLAAALDAGSPRTHRAARS